MKKILILVLVLSLSSVAVRADMPKTLEFNDWAKLKPAQPSIPIKPPKPTPKGNENYWDTSNDEVIPFKPLMWSCGKKCRKANSGEKWLWDQVQNHSDVESVRIFAFIDDLSNKAACLILEKKYHVDTKKRGCKWSHVPEFEKKIIAWINVRDSQIDSMKNNKSIDVVMKEVNDNYGKRLALWSALIHTGSISTFFKDVPQKVMKYIK